MGNLLTVLICTHNRAELLSKTLDSLNRAHRPAGLRVDILIIANACRDATAQVLQDYARRATRKGLLPLRWFDEPQPGKSHALNRGTSKLAGDWVAIVDDDHRVAGDFLIQIERAMQTHLEASMLCGRILPDWNGSEPAWVHDTGPYRIYPLPIPRQDFGEVSTEIGIEGPIPGGGNQIMRVDVLRRLGGFSTDLGPQGHDLGGGEDTEYMLRALRMGARLWYVPHIVQFHYVDAARLTLRYLIQKAYKRSAGTVGLDAGETTAFSVPIYLYRKLASYFLSVLTALGTARRRFYLVRCAAALGEMAGHRRLRHRRGYTISTAPSDDA